MGPPARPPARPLLGGVHTRRCASAADPGPAGAVQGLPRLQQLPGLYLCARRGAPCGGALGGGSGRGRLGAGTAGPLRHALQKQRSAGQLQEYASTAQSGRPEPGEAPELRQVAISNKALSGSRPCRAGRIRGGAIEDSASAAGQCRAAAAAQRPASLRACCPQVRQSAGLLLKNNIKGQYGSLSEEYRTFIKVCAIPPFFPPKRL